MKRLLMTLVVGLVMGACGGVMTGDEPAAEGAPLGQTEQAYRCGFCGDGYCCPEIETSATCPNDCGQPFCGDGVCNTNESSATCSADCGPVPVCGDGVCNGGETSTTCSADCVPQPVCGDGVCGTGESNLSCPADCPCSLGKCW
ncbi:tenascin-X [Myxococcus sp. RHSTA-1-4]|uniref:tenascin-X n=1 Tax=Myxococcus sp. RHSTA-1-4 TaxID=2874601 RepID=UPI001CBC3DA5|nr:tenascin-X [Myxococcus sp. RHSTA-1-4]MBZ4420652.1 tenascin-X [Myxococcus sp. RHSTA-1-4]